MATAFAPPEGRGTQKQRRQLRQIIRKRDGDLCCWCHERLHFPEGEGDQWRQDFATIEHIIPLNRGGSCDLDNLALAHRICNQKHNERRDD